jgi:hypothetical protein
MMMEDSGRKSGLSYSEAGGGQRFQDEQSGNQDPYRHTL